MVRPVLQQPKRLDVLVLKKLGQWIALKGKHLIGPVSELFNTDLDKAEAILLLQIEMIRQYLVDGLPKLYHNALIEELMNALSRLFKTTITPSDEDSKEDRAAKLVLRRMVETLFTENLTILMIENTDLFLTTFCSKASMLTGLVHLKFNLFPWREGNISQVLCELHNLKYLSLQFNCTYSILLCIIQNCKLIEELDIAYSELQDNCVTLLTHLPNLRIVNLNGTSVSMRGAHTLLLCCKNIEDTGLRCLGQVLEQMQNYETLPDEPFQLRTYSGICITEKQMKLVVQKCPLVESITLTKKKGIPNSLMALTELHDLRTLNLAYYEFYSDHIGEVLQVVGRKLINLHMQKVDQIDLNALKHISQTCPNLQKLYLDNCMYTESTSPYMQKLEISPFKNLKKLIFDTSSKANNRDNIRFPGSDLFLYMGQAASRFTARDLEVIKELAAFILANCSNVEFVDFGTSLWLSEEILLNMLEKNPLIYLKELRMNQSLSKRLTLTPKVVEQVVKNCVGAVDVMILLES